MVKKETPQPIPGLVTGSGISKLLRDRRSPYVFVTIKPDLAPEYESKGWEIAKKNKKTFRMRKTKSHDITLEDRTWAMLAKLRWDWMNSGRDLRIRFAKDESIPGKQIDVFAADGEAALVIECKSAESRKHRSFQSEIHDIGHIRKRAYATIKNALGGKPKIAWLFVTSNIIVSRADVARFADNHIAHFTGDDLAYFEQLVEHIGPVAKYQLFGRLFKDQDIPELDTRVPALRGRSGGHEIYSFLVEPELLLKIGYVLHRTTDADRDPLTYQRLVKKSRIKNIERYIKGGGFFPNSIILNIQSKKKPTFDLAGRGEHSSKAAAGVLHLPKKYQSALIIDGQHRLFGYGLTDERLTNLIPAVAFLNLPAQKQSEMFVTINHEQRSVPANLLMSLFAEFHWGSANEGEALNSALTKLVERMNSRNDSMLYKRIVLGEEPRTDQRCITLRYLIGQGLRRTKLLGSVSQDGSFAQGYCWSGNWEGTVEKGYRFLNRCFETVEQAVPEQWRRGQAEGGFITMNVGLSAFVVVIDDVLRHLVATESFQPDKLSPEKMHTTLMGHLEAVGQFLADLEADARAKLRSWGGGSATQKVVREFQNAINSEYESYMPEGLEQWQKESTGQFNDKTRQVVESLQLRISNYIFGKMLQEFGEKNWWRELPEKIQKECSNRQIEGGYEEARENYLMLMNYKDIIANHSALLLDVFTPPEMMSAKKDKRLGWFRELNDVRNKLSHPERDKVTEEEYKSIVTLEEWLSPRLPDGT